MTIGFRPYLNFIVALSCIAVPLRGAEPIDFEQHIAPIFVQHCIRCHSAGSAKGEVSLETIDDLRRNQYVVPGDPDGSYLLELVLSSGGSAPEMPKDGNPLTETELQRLHKWILQGAHWPAEVVLRAERQADSAWWSLQPLNPHSVLTRQVTVDRHVRASSTSMIDHFIHARLTQNDLQPGPSADRRTLLRRLSFDLHGLPPSPAQVEAFVRDSDPAAYDRLVDRMLASPRYGERFAQHWLDIAHYADTHGFERDQRRDHAWRYRDYVIQAWNEDKPYDQFLLEQIAGDVRWPDDQDAVVATGFLAAGPWDLVGQVETKSPQLRRAARSLDLDDMATQVMTATMGMTVHCARCHDHKLDPISQREYYQLRAVFAGLKREDRLISEDALKRYEAKHSRLADKLMAVDFDIGRLEGRGLNLADIVGGGNGLGSGVFRQGIDARSGKTQTREFGKLGNVVTNRFAKCEFDFVDGVFIADGQEGEAQIPISSTGVTISGLPDTSGDAWDMIRNGPVASQHSTELDGIDFTVDGRSLLGLHANAGITFDLSAMREVIGPGDMTLTAKVGYFGAAGANRADVWVIVDGQIVEQFRELKRRDGLQDLAINLPVSARFLTLIATDGGNGFSHDQIGFGDPRIRSASPMRLNGADRQRLEQLKANRIRVAADLNELGPPPRFYGVVASESIPEVQLLNRGDPESPVGNPLSPAAFSALAMLNPELGQLDSGDGERREALARWITHSDNPLTPRVIVNRLWHWHFGQGIVNTPSDFGSGGDLPSHPELLDWLAVQLKRRGWSLKTIQRLILTSGTYRQQSRHSATRDAHSIDAENRLYWRQNPRRIEAEAVRDSVLQVSGNLNLQSGGPGFEDFQYQDAYAPIYTYVTADQPRLWRRSIYRYIVRTTPNRFLTTFDCPDPANLAPKRLTTTTPLQSLALYNNDFILRQAKYFAERIEREVGGDSMDQVRRAFLLAFGRRPDPQEIRLSIRFVDRHGLFALCRSLFNSNEFVYVD